MCSQAAHASVSSIYNHLTGTITDKSVLDWLEQGMKKIVVGCDSEDELFQLAGKTKEYEIIYSLIKDAGKTEFKEPTYTCIAIGPGPEKLIDEITGELKLL
jgi:PTH2 family peptidyl-tRNA hydrolase